MTGNFGNRPSFIDDLARGNQDAVSGFMEPIDAALYEDDRVTPERKGLSNESIQRMNEFLASAALRGESHQNRTNGRSPHDRFPPTSDDQFDKAWEERNNA